MIGGAADCSCAFHLSTKLFVLTTSVLYTRYLLSVHHSRRQSRSTTGTAARATSRGRCWPAAPVRPSTICHPVTTDCSPVCPPQQTPKSEHDWYCGTCHQPGEVLACCSCPAVYHSKCLTEEERQPPFKCSQCKVR